ncbi:HopJ type III effector protein [Colwellia piezophila]|uniref:HopJ type III effector protein n=1 Tax=Colwellia piezophila TaxID=211668 RepID=UPI0003645CDA|nr:HopJ type III effector protein [Colwellia piezophila]
MNTVEKNSNLAELISQLEAKPENVNFEQVMQVIAQSYNYTPARFSNGDLVNEAGTNEGSCKIFYFAKLNKLTEQQTLACFGKFYHHDVLKNPQGNDHGNIRNFMQKGWSQVEFNSVALTSRA